MFYLVPFAAPEQDASKAAVKKLIRQARKGELAAVRQMRKEHSAVVATEAQLIELNQRLKAQELKTREPWLYHTLDTIIDQHL